MAAMGRPGSIISADVLKSDRSSGLRDVPVIEPSSWWENRQSLMNMATRVDMSHSRHSGNEPHLMHGLHRTRRVVAV